MIAVASPFYVGLELFIWFVIGMAAFVIILCCLWIWISKKNYAERLRCSCRYYLNSRCLKDGKKCPCFSWNCPKLGRDKIPL